MQTVVLFLGMSLLPACGQSAIADGQSVAIAGNIRPPVIFVSPTVPPPTPIPASTATPLPSPVPLPTATPTRLPMALFTATAIPPTPTEIVSPIPLPTPTRQSLPVYAPEFPATRLVMPSIGVDAPVEISSIINDTWDVSNLEQSVGHLQGTGSPGKAGNVVLAGHITLAPDGRAGPFYRLGGLSPGDMVAVYHGDEKFVYQIDGMTTVAPTDVQVAYPTQTSRLTLITCQSYDDSLAEYMERLVVFGHLVP